MVDIWFVGVLGFVCLVWCLWLDGDVGVNVLFC